MIVLMYVLQQKNEYTKRLAGASLRKWDVQTPKTTFNSLPVDFLWSGDSPAVSSQRKYNLFQSWGKIMQAG
jgi:hypothetical protein